jgi:hypothetical protein
MPVAFVQKTTAGNYNAICKIVRFMLSNKVTRRVTSSGRFTEIVLSIKQTDRLAGWGGELAGTSRYVTRPCGPARAKTGEETVPAAAVQPCARTVVLRTEKHSSLRRRAAQAVSVVPWTQFVQNLMSHLFITSSIHFSFRFWQPHGKFQVYRP